jgi:hypothetical protein
MNKEIAREIATRWLARLRDPKSKQAWRLLQDHDHACALGHGALVCADLLGLPVKRGFLRRPAEPNRRAFVSDVIKRMVAFGFKEACLNHVIKLNDQDWLSLPEIADWLENQLQRDGVLP